MSRLERIRQRKTLLASQSKECTNEKSKIACNLEGILIKNNFDEEQGQQADQILIELAKKFEKNKLQSLMEGSRAQILGSIIPFGLSTKMATSDKDGGNVDTVHNVRQGVYATDLEKESYNDRPKYNNAEYHHKNANYNQEKKFAECKKNNGGLIDESSGQKFKETSEGKIHSNLDHIISANEIHNDPGTHLAQKDTVDLANQSSNFQNINASVNKAKGSNSTEGYLSKRVDRINDKNEKIEFLKSRDNLSKKQQNELKNADNYVNQHSNVDPERMLENDRNARKVYEDQINDYYKSQKFVNSTAKASLTSGAKMGGKAAFGIFLSNFVNHSYDEIANFTRHGRKEEDILVELKKRLTNVVTKVAKDWRTVTDGFLNGCISGFLTEIVTIIINIFAKTSKRIVTAIREGGASLIRALNLVFVRSHNMDLNESLHEASKILGAGVLSVGGLLLDEVVDKAIVTHLPFLAFVSGMISTVIVGFLVAITSCFLTYLLDKLDFFGSIGQKRLEYINGQLTGDLESSLTLNSALAIS